MTVRMGAGDFVYDAHEDWAKLPAGWTFREVPDVVCDGQDRVYVFSRGDHKMVVFDRDGNLVDAWGDGLFDRPHAVTLDLDGTLWCVDDGDHTVRKMTLDGKVLQTLGTAGQPAPFASGEPFNRPTKVAPDPVTGDLFITDGYGNARVHRFTREGRHVLSWGAFGIEPGHFNLSHMVVADDAGKLYVADRENHRIQVFDGEGNLLTIWQNIHRPCGIYLDKRGSEPLLFIGCLPTALAINATYPNLGARVSVRTLDGKEVAWIGAAFKGLEPDRFLAPHGLAVDSRGDLYVGEVSWADYGRHLNPPQEVRSFRKLVRVR